MAFLVTRPSHRPVDLRVLHGALSRLEPGAGKLARRVLRGPGDGDVTRLPDWVVLDHPELPLTNHTAERALRHWVIARRISYGTRNPQGSRAFTLLASVIETCRQRGHSPWLYIAETLRERRRGNPAPLLPAAIG